MDIAFKAAREADPSAKLIFNDDNNETPDGIMTKLTRETVTRLKSEGLIDGVGLEMHLDGSNPPKASDVIETMKSYGLPVYVTEFDVNLKNVTGTETQRFAKQAEIYKDMVTAFIDSGVCKGITFWGISDNTSVWETEKGDPMDSPKAEPLLFDSSLAPKPAYAAVLQVLQQAAASR